MAEQTLPQTEPELVESCELEYKSVFQSGASQDVVDGARCRLVWSMAHSRLPRHQQRALEIARAQISANAGDLKEYHYLAAVACYKLGKYLEARRDLTAVLEEHSHFRQAQTLKVLVDDAVMRDGLVGVGVVGALAVGAALLIGLMRKH